MKQIFSMGEGFPVPDGTIVCPAIDVSPVSRAAGQWTDAMSIAGGEILPGVTSKIHVHPVVTQVTWVLAGRLTIRMKDARSSEAYELPLQPNQSVWTEPGTFFQLINPHREPCRVLYIVTPAFVFEMNASGEVIYNDAVILDADWLALAKQQWKIPESPSLEATHTARSAAIARLQRSQMAG